MQCVCAQKISFSHKKTNKNVLFLEKPHNSCFSLVVTWMIPLDIDFGLNEHTV